MRIVLSLILCCFSLFSFSQRTSGVWVDSVYNSLTEDERIAQLIIVRLSTIDLKTNIVTYYDKEVEYLVKDNEGHGFYNEENRFDFYRLSPLVQQSIRVFTNPCVQRFNIARGRARLG